MLKGGYVLNITKEADYAIRVINYLSNINCDEIISASIIAEKEKIPSQFLLKILRKLRKANLIQSFMGVNGGYKLKKEPKNITLKEVIEAIDGPIYLNRCLYNPDECNKNFSSKCPIHYHLSIVEKELVNHLDNINFEDIKNTKL